MKKVFQFIIRYRILHIAVWLYVLFGLFHEMEINHVKNTFRHLVNASIVVFSEMATIYFVVYFLMPKLINRGKYFLFSLASLATLFVGVALQELLRLIFIYYIFNYPYFFHGFIAVIVFISSVLPLLLAFVGIILLYDQYVKMEKDKLIEKERLETELNFLKSQINPHFLFNAFNSIYVLMKEDINLAEQTLLKFSSLLRYQLYDCNNDETTLENEIDFLKNFIDLEKVRNGDTRIVTFNIPEQIAYYKIAPFILIPFVENAFKHISHFKDKPNKISISIDISNYQLYFHVENTYDNTLIQNETTSKGIGLQNVQRRLELLYPKKHTLAITKLENIYSVNLSIHLNEN